MVNIISFVDKDGGRLDVNSKELTDRGYQDEIAAQLGISVEELRCRLSAANANQGTSESIFNAVSEASLVSAEQ